MDMSDFSSWLFNVMTKGLSVTTHRYYSIYRALVTDNKDPDGRGRVKIQCAQAGHSAPIDKWVLPALPGAGPQRGFFFAPEINDTVWISFYEGDPSKPEVYFGGWFGETTPGTPDTPLGATPSKDFNPEKKGIYTRAGHQILINDEDGKEQITILWNKPADDDPARKDRSKTAAINPKANAVFTFDKDGSMLMKTPSSYLIHLDEVNKTATMTSPGGSMFTISKKDAISLIHKSGASVSVSDSSIDLAGTSSMNVNISGKNVILNAGGILLGGQAQDYGVLGLKLIQWLALHVHATALGPSTPPMIPPLPTDFLSTSVKIQG